MTLVVRLLPSIMDWEAANQFAMDGGLLSLMVITVVDRKRQSDNQEHNCENFVISHGHHLLL